MDERLPEEPINKKAAEEQADTVARTSEQLEELFEQNADLAKVHADEAITRAEDETVAAHGSNPMAEAPDQPSEDQEDQQR